MTLKTLVNDAQDLLFLPRSSVAFTSEDDNVKLLVGLSNQEGRQLSRRYDWQDLLTETTFVSTATTEQTGALPSDFEKIVNETLFNRTQTRKVTGPMSAAEWQSQQAITASLLTDSFRIRGDALLITPTPEAGDTYAFEYVSKNWCQSSGGTGQAQWAADEDTGVLDEDLMLLGLVWRFRKARGFDYAEEFNSYEQEVTQSQMRDGGKRILDYGRASNLSQQNINVPEGSWSL